MTAFSSRAYRCATGFSSVLFFILVFSAVSAHSATYVGATQGLFKVSESGAATYAVPLLTPPGVAGIQPSLSLIYNSQSGEGYLGKGWSLAGLSAITRCPQIIPVEGKARGVRLDTADRYCLDGQRLVAVTGAYGATGTEYRTEIESFSKVVSSGTAGYGPASFTVWTKAGQVLEFGNTADSRIEAQGKPTVLVWALNKVSDRNGNTMTATYSETNSTGTYLPLKIDYIGNGSVAPSSSVEFSYVVRHKGMQTRYVAGSRISNHSVLDKVRTKNGATVVREYQLAYGNDPNTEAWRLTSITECTTLSGLMDCLSPTTFAWQDGANDGFFIPSSTASICSNGSTVGGTCNDADNYDTIQYPDINGDGRADLCFRSDSGVTCYLATVGTGFGWGTSIATSICANGSTANGICNDTDNHYTIRFADFNGDGMQDLVFRSDAGLRVYRLNYTSNNLMLLFTSGICRNGSTTYGTECEKNFTSIWYPDLNADGRADVCYRAKEGIKCFLGTGSGWGAYVSTTICASGSTAHGGCNDEDNYETIRFADLNGDGKQDLVFRSDSGIRAFQLNEGNNGLIALYTETLCGNTDTDCLRISAPDCSGLSPAQCAAALQSAPRNYQYLAYPDVNADGLADICYRATQGIRCRMGTGSAGSGFGGDAIYTTICGDGSTSFGTCNSIDNYSTIRFVDINGDGKSDLVYRGDEGMTTWLSTGANFVNRVTKSLCANGSNSWGVCNDDDNYKTIAFADYNGDGMADLFFRSDNGIRPVKWTGKFPNQITTLTNGLGVVTTLSYKPATDATIYTKGTGAVYPDANIQPALSVVEYHDTSDGIGGLYRLSYKYADARANRVGRGFLGFQTVTVKDEETGIETVNSYRQDFPYVGRPSVSVKRYAITTGYWELSRSTNTYAALNLGVGRYYPYVSTSNDKTYELDTALLTNPLVSDVTTTSVYDTFGNPTSITTSTPDGHKKATINTYSNDTVNWLLGKLTRTEVTSTLPDLTTQKRTSAFAYDSRGLLVQEVVEPDQLSLRLSKYYTYDVFGNRTGTMTIGADIVLRSSSTSYDAQGRFPVQTMNEMGHVEKYVYDSNFGVMRLLTGPNNLSTEWMYDVFGRKTMEHRADSTGTEWAYSICGTSSACPPLARALVEATDDGSPPKTVYSDVLGREVRSAVLGFNGQWIYRDTEYDNAGRVTRVSRPYYTGSTTLHWSTFAYDRLGRVTQQTAPDGAVTMTAYKGLETVVTNARNYATTQLKNSQGQVVKVTDALGGATTYTYDHFGNLIKTVDAKGNAITATYDLRGRKTAMADPDMGPWAYTYNVLGELTRQTDAKAQTTTFEYDKLGRMTKRIEPGLTSTWIYDGSSFGIGKLSETGTSTGMWKVLSYDSFGRPKGITVNYGTPGVSYYTQTNYDALSRPEKILYPSGFSVINVYNDHGYLTEVRNATTAEVYWRAMIQNADSQVVQERLGNGLLTVRSYDVATGRLKTVNTNQGGILPGPAVQALSYSYDAAGNVIEVMDGALTETFVLDGLNRVTRVSQGPTPVKTYGYDAIGNFSRNRMSAVIHMARNPTP